ncbi:MAG: hypothetical protein HQ541_11635 [Mariniphaga sp.]|nr:hypothetical protein [Mariniphaga sp.]
MKLQKTLHAISHFKWFFLAWMIVLIAYVFVYLPENKISIVGSAIFLSGIFMGLESLSDIEKMSVKEKKQFLKPGYVKRASFLILSCVAFLILVSILFLTVSLIITSNNASMAKDFANLGYDCLAMILGFLCLLKQIHEKAKFVKE